MSEKGAKKMGYMRHGDASTYTSHDGMQRVTTLQHPRTCAGETLQEFQIGDRI
jgi:hypothetical protein